jgi:hypothetical protein
LRETSTIADNKGRSATAARRWWSWVEWSGVARRDHAINLLDAFTGCAALKVYAVDSAWTSRSPIVARLENATTS